ncbi:hypothetical protein ACFVU2_15125 [Leifsonia sp. NPDC058194]|uniref:hypothetical protein n=1 Tax=Leifsonia sp. NPDC058194 TaxID=3346374 RepID=UPI0036DA9ED8
MGLWTTLAPLIVGAAVVPVQLAPSRSAVILDALSGWLTRHNRVLMITLGLVFGSSFAVKALAGFGVFRARSLRRGGDAAVD